ncbi:hypothetical protein E3O06_07155 [Cryobacterium glaciale]|uniref:EamA family transporter n=1 Tax=Cryobacterium glaciale TaxID=1259145 RepID=A0A4R8UZZ8_9MICO|nr:hypothetical protein [Cryobacterium glaciale]TFB74310.1 hypothetical protein E3O06_07155 [Cryobacterium glaciale]
MTFAWGSCFLAITKALQDSTILWLAALRALIAGAVLLLVAGYKRAPNPRTRKTWTLIARIVHADAVIVAAGQLLIGGAVLALVAVVVEGPPVID